MPFRWLNWRALCLPRSLVDSSSLMCSFKRLFFVLSSAIRSASMVRRLRAAQLSTNQRFALRLQLLLQNSYLFLQSFEQTARATANKTNIGFLQQLLAAARTGDAAAAARGVIFGRYFAVKRGRGVSWRRCCHCSRSRGSSMLSRETASKQHPARSGFRVAYLR